MDEDWDRPPRLSLPPPSVAPLHLARERLGKWKRQAEVEPPRPAQGRFPYP